MALIALLVTAGFFFLRSDGGDETREGKTEKEVTIGDLELVVGGVYNANAGTPAQLSPDLQNNVMTTVGLYVEGGILKPVVEGEVSEDTTAIFDAATQPRLNGPDRPVIFEEGLPELTASFEPLAQPVILTALSDAGGNFVLVTAILNYSALYETDAGQITSNRYSELTMLPSEDGVWRITGYDIVVTREGPGTQATTTTAAA